MLYTVVCGTDSPVPFVQKEYFFTRKSAIRFVYKKRKHFNMIWLNAIFGDSKTIKYKPRNSYYFM
ncbi:MAG: hypothetical protein PVF17_00065 [Ignavibacteria bacterium]|jgi:hypothetical protein